jgi:hypothetical protein
MSDLGAGYDQSLETSSNEKVDRELDKLTISKLDNVELKEITETTRSNLNSMIQN